MHGVKYILTFGHWGVQAALDISNIWPLKVNSEELASLYPARVHTHTNWHGLVKSKSILAEEHDVHDCQST
jgi:hypothetical protein